MKKAHEELEGRGEIIATFGTTRDCLRNDVYEGFRNAFTGEGVN